MNHFLDSLAPPSRRILVITAVGIVLAFAQAAVAAPMRCSGEQTICINSCKKNPDRSTLSICITNCGVRQSACKKNGCWDTGFQKYCGLLKQ
jgi:hypothetical protein